MHHQKNYFKTLALYVFSVLLMMSLSHKINASDHYDLMNSDNDLTDFYAFKSPTDATKLVLMVNLVRSADKDSRFSEEQEFNFVLRHTKGSSIGGVANFELGKNEVRFSCQFNKANAGNAQKGMCEAPNGERLTLNTNDINGAQGKSFRVFAGLRSDPFFVAPFQIAKNFLFGTSSYPNPGSNGFADANTLSIVIETDINANLGSLLTNSDGTKLALRVEVINSLNKLRIDSIGRPEHTNMIMGAPIFDAGQRFTLMGEIFSMQDTFNRKRTQGNEFRQRINVNLKRWDNIDEIVDWPLVNGIHPLTELTYNDYLILDMAKPFSDKGYFEIEQSLLNGKDNTTSGGRWLTEDVIDIILTTLTSDGHIMHSDYVNQPNKPVSKKFPYLASPD